MTSSFVLFAEKLKNQIMASDIIYIVGHSKIDLDALASSLGIYNLVNNWKKKAYIIIDEDYKTMEAGCKKIINDIKNINYITSNNLQINSRDMLIILDTNNINLISIKDLIPLFSNVAIIDHHCKSENMIMANNSFIVNESAASKMVVDLKEYYHEVFLKEIMECLIAGIYLDTYNLTNKQTNVETIETVLKLLQQGSELALAMQYFVKDYEKEAKFQELEDLTEIYHYKYLVSIGTKVYASEAIAAKASQFSLEYPDMDGIFVIGKLLDGNCKMSARSNGKLNIGKLMESLGGGGSVTQGAVLTKELPDELKRSLIKKLTP